MKSIYEILPDDRWLISGSDKVPMTYAVAPISNIVPANVTDPKAPMPFESVCQLMGLYGLDYDIGYVLNGDGIVCVDIDVKNSMNEDDATLWTPDDVKALQKDIARRFAEAGAYIERSRSGQGFHIWVKCAQTLLPFLNRRSKKYGIEIYSDKRYIVCTGQRVSGGDELIDGSMLVWETLGLLGLQTREPVAPAVATSGVGPAGGPVVPSMSTSGPAAVATGVHTALPAVVTADGVLTDEALIRTGLEASNGDKFRALCRGEWQELGYPSQSEADLSLMSMLAFYSRDDEQCIRVFRLTELGKREKAQRTDYLARTLRSIRRRQYRENQALEIAMAVPVLVSETMNAVEAATVNPDTALAADEEAAALGEVRALTGVTVADDRPVDRITGTADASLLEGLDDCWQTPGRMGRLVNWILSASYLPVYEIAESAAIGLAAGICGRAWNIPGSGLNMYILLVAKSAIGKEALHTSISKIQTAVMKHNPGIANFISFDEHASGQGLLRAVAERPSHVAVMGEFGRRLKAITTRDEGPLATYRTYLTNLYQKSGQGSSAGGLRYSDNERNVTINGAVAFSLVGETTPGTFYESLDSTVMEDGFMSRFLTITYDGDRPYKNDNMANDLTPELLEYITQLSIHAAKLNSINQVCMVEFEDKAGDLIQAFDDKCAEEIRKTDDESYRQSWNRAALKAKRLAALCAVMENYIAPKTTLEMVQWSICLVQKDIDNFMNKLRNGDIGGDDATRDAVVMSTIKGLLTGEEWPRFLNGKPIDKETGAMLMRAGVVTEASVKFKCRKRAAFNTQRGYIFETEKILNNLVAAGILFKIPTHTAMTEFGTPGACYKVINPEIFRND